MFGHGTLTGKHALVCGASQGIGRACAEELAKAGAKVTLLARNGEALEAVRKNLAQAELGHRSIVCDLGDLNSIPAALARLDQPVDILVCNSGGPSPGPLLDAQIPALEQAFRQHLLASMILVQTLAPAMREKKWGRIINIISTSVKAPLPNLGVSNTVRGAVGNWSKTLAGELGPHGITVNNILPGFTETQRLTQIISNSMQRNGQSREDVIADMSRDVPARRFASASELAYACVFLASPMAGYINGINLPVDGGRTVCL